MNEFRLVIQEVIEKNDRKFYGKSKSFSFLSNKNLEDTHNEFKKIISHNSPSTIREEKLKRIRRYLNGK